MSYLSYMTNHYQHARNDHANATRFMKCLKHYRSKKSSLQFETTENEWWYKIPTKHSLLQVIQILRIKLCNFLYAYRHIAFTMITLKAGNCSSTVCNIIVGSIVGRNCRLLCKLTVGSSLTVLLGMWITRILAIWIQNH